jgi:hypothetical protein
MVLMFCDSMSGPKVTASKQYTQTEYEKKRKKKRRRQPLKIYWLPIRLKVHNTASNYN